MARSWNLFSIGRQTGNEDQLTEMLVWLARAVPTVQRALVELGPGPTVDPVGVMATTQYVIPGRRLDALLEGDGFRLAVESKLGSDYQDDQIGSYLEWLADHKSSKAWSGLMTLTARSAPWEEKDLQYARDKGLGAYARRWEDLHDLLEPVATKGGDDALEGRMVREFLEMLADEDLVPTRPLDHVELGTRWADAWRDVRRYGEFFDACKEAIAEALRGKAFPNRSARGDFLYQDYSLPDTSRLVVGLYCTDENEKLSPGSRAPILWVGVRADHLERWTAIARAMETDRPAGWREGHLWDGRPTIWRPLLEVVGPGTFEEQRSRLAGAAGDATRWLDDAVAHVESSTANTSDNT